MSVLICFKVALWCARLSLRHHRTRDFFVTYWTLEVSSSTWTLSRSETILSQMAWMFLVPIGWCEWGQQWVFSSWCSEGWSEEWEQLVPQLSSVSFLLFFTPDPWFFPHQHFWISQGFNNFLWRQHPLLDTMTNSFGGWLAWDLFEYCEHCRLLLDWL